MKYMGSKARFSKEILPIILKDREVGQWYVEPFAGGMNTICDVDGNRIANDIHEYLISMWKGIVDNTFIPEKIDRELYNKIKNDKVNWSYQLVGWVGFNCSYSGKWFSGFAGETITKSGLIRDYQKEAIKNINTQSKKLKGVIFQNTSYNKMIIPDKSIIYCDPPYKGTTKYKDAFDHTLFWNWCREKLDQGHTIFVSEYEAPSDFKCVWEKETKSSLSANGKIGGSKVSVEKLFKI